MKMTKFYDLKKSIEKLGGDYKIAKKNGNTKEMDKIQAEYESERKKLCHYREQIAKLDVVKMSAAIDSGKLTPAEKRNFKVLLGERTIYEQNRKNKQFVNIVEGNDNMDSFNHKNGQKALNLVKRQFDKIIVGAALVGLGSWALVGCSSKKEDTKEQISVSTEVNTENNTNTPATDKNTEVTTNDENKFKYVDEANKETEEQNNESNDSKFTILNDLPEIDEKEDVKTNSNDNSNGNNQNEDNKKGGKKVTVTVKPPEKKVVEERLDPHVDNKDTGTTTEVVVKDETTTEEPDPIDYPQKDTSKSTELPTEEIITIKINEEPNTEEPAPVDYPQKDTSTGTETTTTEGKTTETTEENVTIIENEEETKIDENVPIDGEPINNKQTIENKQNSNIQNIQENEEIVILEEQEEKKEMNTDDDLPIEGKIMIYAPNGVRGGILC